METRPTQKKRKEEKIGEKKRKKKKQFFQRDDSSIIQGPLSPPKWDVSGWPYRHRHAALHPISVVYLLIYFFFTYYFVFNIDRFDVFLRKKKKRNARAIFDKNEEKKPGVGGNVNRPAKPRPPAPL